MGNSNSHGSSYATSDTQVIPPHSWAYSFPRSQYFRPSNGGSKVLPSHVPGQRLRPTENGSMLHNAGTITGKRPYEYMHRDEVSAVIYILPRNIRHIRFPVTYLHGKGSKSTLDALQKNQKYYIIIYRQSRRILLGALKIVYTRIPIPKNYQMFFKIIKYLRTIPKLLN